MEQVNTKVGAHQHQLLCFNQTRCYPWFKSSQYTFFYSDLLEKNEIVHVINFNKPIPHQ